MEQLEKYFDTAFGAPDGIKKLRELILSFAIQGKLTKQNPKEKSSLDIIEVCSKERKSLIKKGIIRTPKTLPSITNEEIPFSLPNNWTWARLDDLVPMTITDGDWIESNDQDINGKIRLIQLADIGVGEFKDVSSRYINDSTFERLKCTELLKDDILIARLPNPIGRACIFPGLSQKVITAVDVAILRVVEGLNKSYLVHAINSRYFRTQVESFGKGATRFRISTGNLKTILVPIPPREEQDRIVLAIEELMSRCDELEMLRAERDQKRLDVHTAAIRKLLDAPDQVTFDDAWQFITRHFGDLYTVRENVAELRKAILQLAVMGKLVKTNSTISYIPLKDLTTKIGSGSTPSGGKNAYHKSGIPLIRSMNVHFGGFVYDGLAFINEDQAKKLNNVIVQSNDILLNITGASIGRVTIAPKEMNGARVNQHVCILRTKDMLKPQFLEIFLSSPMIQNWIQDIQVGATREALTKAKIEEIKVPVPSVPDQIKMIRMAKKLLELCNDLERQIDMLGEKQMVVLDAIM